MAGVSATVQSVSSAYIRTIVFYPVAAALLSYLRINCLRCLIRRLFFCSFIFKNERGKLCQILKKNHIGKENIIPSSAIVNVNIFPVIRELIRTGLTAFSATALSMPWGAAAAVISDIQTAASRTARDALFPTSPRIMAILQENTANWRK